MRVLVIDNYDSFTFNLVQALGELGAEPRVYRNDVRSIEELAAEPWDRVLISPGPGNPSEAGISAAVIERFSDATPTLGVCLGHQCIAQLYGARVVHAARPVHGKTSLVSSDGKGVFYRLPKSIEAARYHSLVVEPESMPPVLEASAWTAEGEIMGLRHRSRLLEGVQFHPESFMTTHGKDLLLNFLDGRVGAAA